MKRNIPIVFSINEQYCGKLAVVISSVLANSGSQFDFYVLAINISLESISKLECLVKDKSRGMSNIRILDPSVFIEDDLGVLLNKRDGYNYISIETFYRFYIHKVLPDLDKVVYLDADLLVLGDMADFYRIELGGSYAGVVADMWMYFCCQSCRFKVESRPSKTIESYIKEVLGVKNREYFNAGVMLLNLKKMREEELDEKLLKFAKDQAPLEFQDQDALNAILGNNVIFCDLSWNVLKDVELIARQLVDSTFKQRVLKAKSSPKIVHYTGGNKPWCVDILEYDYIKEWWEFYCETDFCTDKDVERKVRILSSERYRGCTSYLKLKIKDFDLLHIYRENFRYNVILFGKLVFRRRMRF